MTWPTELRVDKARQTLTVIFDSGECFALPAEYLRVESPSAEVQGHGPSQKQIVPGKKDVRIVRVEPIGNYATRIVFDDGHDTGLYSWDYLNELGREQSRKWPQYLAALKRNGMNRETTA